MPSVDSFTPSGKSYVVSTSTVQIPSQDNVNPVAYRIVNSTSSTVTLAWSPNQPLGTQPTIGSVTAPTAGSPTNTLTFLPGAVEVVGLPPNVWMKADTASSLIVTPGEGL